LQAELTEEMISHVVDRTLEKERLRRVSQRGSSLKDIGTELADLKYVPASIVSSIFNSNFDHEATKTATPSSSLSGTSTVIFHREDVSDTVSVPVFPAAPPPPPVPANVLTIEGPKSKQTTHPDTAAIHKSQASSAVSSSPPPKPKRVPGMGSMASQVAAAAAAMLQRREEYSLPPVD
jgi:hypothetical protein